jgi:hypothetical protein
MRVNSRPSVGLVVLTLSIGLGACAEPTPEERVAMLRARYEARMNGFFVDQRPVGEPAAPAVTDSEDVGEEAAEGAPTEPGTEVETVVQEPVALVQDVMLDIEIRHESPEKLDGITVDITMADGEREIRRWRAWFDTSSLEKGPGFQYSHKLEDVDYRPGFGFSAEIRHPIPPEERSSYREFSSLGG